MKKLKKIGSKNNKKKLLILSLILLILFLFLSSVLNSITYYVEKSGELVKVGEDFEIKIIVLSKDLDLDILKLPDLQKNENLKIYNNYPIIEKEKKFIYNGIFFNNLYKITIKYKFRAVNKGQVDFSGLKINTNLGQIIINDFSIFITDSDNLQNDDFIRIEIDRDSFFIGEEIIVKYYLYTSNEFETIKNIKISRVKEYYYEIVKKDEKLVQILFLNKPYKKYKIAELRIVPKKLGEFFTPDIEFSIIFNSFENLERIKIEKVIKSDKKNFNIISFPQEIPKDFIYLIGDYTINYKYQKLSSKEENCYILYINFQGIGNHNIVDFTELLKENPNYEIVKINQIKTLTSCEIQYFILFKNKNLSFLPSINFSYFNIKENIFKSIIIAGEKVNFPQKTYEKKEDLINFYYINLNKDFNNYNFYLKIYYIIFLLIFFILIFIVVILIIKKGINIKIKNEKINKLKKQNNYACWLDFVEKLKNRYNIDLNDIDRNFDLFYNKLSFLFKKKDIQKIYYLNKFIKLKYSGENYSKNDYENKKIRRLIEWLSKLNF